MPARFKSFTGDLNADAYELLAMRQNVASQMQAFALSIEAELKEAKKKQEDQPKT